MVYSTAGIGPISNIKMGRTENKRGGGGGEVSGVGKRRVFQRLICQGRGRSLLLAVKVTCYLEMLFVFVSSDTVIIM